MSQWKRISLGDAATFHNGYAFKPSDWSKTGKEIIRIQNLTKGSAQINYFEGELPDKYKVRQGDIIISWSGSLGVYEWNNEEAWLNQHLFKVVFDKEELNKSFFKHLISVVLKEMEGLVHGATMKHITKQKFDAFQIPLPPLEQQKKIAAILDAADTLRQKDKALVSKYDELTQALFLDMFGDPVSNPKVWEKKTLNELCNKITDGTHDTPKRLTEGIKFITGKHIRPFEIDYINSDYVTEEVHKEIFKRCNPEYGDILYTNIGVNFATAAMNIVDYEFSMKNVALLKYKRDILNGRFLESILNNEFFKDRLKNAFGIGGAQQFLSLSNIKAIQVLCPPIKLQNQFAERVAIIGQQKVQAQASLEKSEELFNSLLHKAFKGELA